MSKSRYKSCYLTDLATAAGVDVRTFASWLTPEDMIQMIRKGHHILDRKLKPKVVEFLVKEYIPELGQSEFIETG